MLSAAEASNNMSSPSKIGLKLKQISQSLFVTTLWVIDSRIAIWNTTVRHQNAILWRNEILRGWCLGWNSGGFVSFLQTTGRVKCTFPVIVFVTWQIAQYSSRVLFDDEFHYMKCGYKSVIYAHTTRIWIAIVQKYRSVPHNGSW